MGGIWPILCADYELKYMWWNFLRFNQVERKNVPWQVCQEGSGVCDRLVGLIAIAPEGPQVPGTSYAEVAENR